MTILTTLKIAALKVQIPFELLRAICTVESGLDTKAFVAVDGLTPSYGVCQVKYKTAKFLGFTGRASQLNLVHINTYYAARYIKYQLKRYKGDTKKAISAYNRGTAHSSNRKYVSKVLKVMELAYNSNEGL